MSLDSRNEDLNQKIGDTDLPSAVATLVKDAKKRKRQLRLLATSIILDIVLTVGLTFLSIRTHNLAVTADSNHSAIVRSCESSNDARASNKQLWHFLLDLPTPNAQTIQQQTNRDKFSMYVDKTFAPRDCNAIN